MGLDKVVPIDVRKTGGGAGGSSGPPEDPADNKLVRLLIGVLGAATIFGLTVIFLSSGGPQVKPPVEHPLTGSFWTAKGEYGCWKLPDFSDVCLNTATVVRFSYSRRARNVEVVEGEAIFTVQHAPRPFQVLVGGMLVRDVGTQFSVYKKGTTDILTVVDGRVRAKAAIDDSTRRQFMSAEPESDWSKAPEFRRLQQLEFDESTGALHAPHLLSEQELSRLLTWQHGQIDLTGMRLGAALEELGRYQPIDRFTYMDEELRQLPVGGLVDNPKDLMGYLATLKGDYGIQYTLSSDSEGRTVVILSRRPDVHAHSK